MAPKIQLVLASLFALSMPVFAAPPAKPVAQSEVLTAKSKNRLVAIEANLKGAKELYLVVSDEGGNSCDWANWIEPELVMADGTVKPLTDLKWKSAKTGHGEIHIGKNLEGRPLSVAGKTFEKGIGMHAPGMIAYDLPDGVVKFQTKVATAETCRAIDSSLMATGIVFGLFSCLCSFKIIKKR